MQELDVSAVLHAAMLVMLKLCAPLLLAPLAAGLVVAVFQAVTQINDSGLAFLPKLVATGVSAWLTGPFVFQNLSDFTRMVMDRIVAIGGQ